jgi:LuxR family maltose regulon positive regulatory protein
MMGIMNSGVEADALAGGRGPDGIVSRPRLFERLAASARVTVVSAPAGSGKTVLLQSWISYAGLTGSAACVSVARGGGDPAPFWMSLLSALRETIVSSPLVPPMTPAPDLDGWGIVERLLAELAPLGERLWLVVDDVHELGRDARGQLELLILRAPPQARFVLATRHDVQLGLHRQRLEGELVEVRGPDLRFTLAEAEELFAAAGVQLSSVSQLVERTEGWAAGLRLAVLSLAGHREPERFAEDFSGSERTVAEYLLAEVLDRQPEPVRRLLLRTSILDRVNGELAGLLTGESGGERWLQDLEAANAFVVALDSGRSWFRYHRLFADLLRLELRRTAPDEVTALHQAAAGWFAGHGFPVEAIRHAQAAQDWDRAVAMLADRWPALYLDGQTATVQSLLAAFPAEARMADTELAVLSALDELTQGSLETAERYLGLAESAMAPSRDARHDQVQLLLGITRLLYARQRGSLATVVEESHRLQAVADASDPTQPDLGADLRALALINLGTAELWANQLGEAERHLDAGLALARQIGRPYLEFTGLAYLTDVESFRSVVGAVERARQVVELALQHGWADDPAAGLASLEIGSDLVHRGRLDEAEPWIQWAERTIRTDAEPAVAIAVRFMRGLLELSRGRDAEALAAFEAADRLAARLLQPSFMVLPNRSLIVQTLLRLGETERAAQAFAQLDDRDRDDAMMSTTVAALRLAEHNPQAAITALAPVLDGFASRFSPGQPALSEPEAQFWGSVFLWEALARDALGDSRAAASALERALDVAEPDGVLMIFLVCPVPSLLENYARQRTAHASLVADIQSVLAGRQVAPEAARPEPLLEPLSDSEIRVLRYLPTNLTGPQIARELYVSINTVRTHMRHLYEKLGTHTRADTVARGRALGLLAPSAHRDRAT